jgi:hypothetical protein
MSTRFRRASVLRAIGMLAFLSVAVRGENGQTPDVPPPRALDVAADLARQRVTAGVVMCWPEDHEGQVPGDLLPDHGPDKTACDELNVSLFQRREGGVLHVRTTREPGRVTELLNRSIDLEAATDVQAIDAVMRVILNAVRGNGSSGAHSSSGVRSTPVSIRGGRTTLMEALDDVVRQVPGLVWLATFAPHDGGSNFQIILLGPPGDGGGGTCVFQMPPDGSGSFCPP